MTADVVVAYFQKNKLPADQISEALKSVHRSLAGLVGEGGTGSHAALKPAVPIRKSLTPDYIVCLEDGRKLKMLKRHLRNAFGLSPDEYRAKWGLPVDYPIVAPNYAAKRSALAKKIGLGRTGGRKRRSKK
ncbi:MAG: MucR family transcriptional regulator [Nitrospiraceae bacterium]